ncbi:S8 family serine peptidase [Streptomyces sp. NPDC051940]|uniref:S8 family serine peptidase n=1 Tax=Streptomyces sp. NPDC051940 TaxID=3155675 RepID=UPI0034272FF8
MRPPHPPHRRGRAAAALAAVMAVAAGGLAVPTVAAADDPAAAPAATAPASAETETHTVTLITGDTVTTTTDASGREATAVDALDARTVFSTRTDADGHLNVVPRDAEPLIADGTLDPELFDVTQLVADGYDDARTSSLPVIVDYRDAPGRTRIAGRTDALPGTRRGAVLDAIGAGAARVDKGEGRAFTQAVAASHEVRKVWLDAKVTASLDVSVPHIGAPEAWDEGYDGKGVKVAVLDTGIDLTHPDVAARVVATRSFVPGVESAKDGHGHGTHVASTIAGSGAASGGRYKGVAPQADLMVGKVLNDAGQGSASSVIGGMQWAVENGAKVVSLSLGSPGGDGLDPMSQAVNELSAETGALFVIAAGNSGPATSTIGSPGAADAALAVAAYSKTDELAYFSSRGPRAGDFALKPEIAAPGVDIVAARAAGTAMGTPVSASYTSASGTSMATPHVAGAAAILAQRHPGWTGQRLKDALMSTSVWVDGDTPYQQGAGRVDVAASVDRVITASGKADFGEIRWQEGTRPSVTRTVTYRNDGGADATLALTAQGPASGGVTVSPATVTVPAGGSAQATLTYDPNALGSGEQGGTLTATAADGTAVHTVFAAYNEPPRHEVALTLKDRHGNAPESVRMTLQSEDGTIVQGLTLLGRGTARYRLPVGRYSIVGEVVTGGTPDEATDLFALPSIDLRKEDRELTVDARQAKDFEIEVPDETRPLERSSMFISLRRRMPGVEEPAVIGLAGLLNTSDQRFGAIPSGDVPFGSLNLTYWETDREPLVQAAVNRPEDAAEPLRVLVPQQSARFAGRRDLQPVDAGRGSEEELTAADVAGKLALIEVDSPTFAPTEIRAAMAHGAAAVMLVPATAGTLAVSAPSDTKLPVMAVDHAQGQRLRELARTSTEPVRVRLTGTLESTYTYQGHKGTVGIPADPALRAGRAEFAVEKAAFHSEVARPGTETRYSWDTLDDNRSVRSQQTLGAPVERTDYVWAAPGVRYQQWVQQVSGVADYMNGPTRAVKADSVHRTSWYAAPSHPSVAQTTACAYCRTTTGLRFTAPLQGDSDPEHYGTVGPQPTWSYYRDGQRVTGLSSLLVDAPAAYRVVLDTKRRPQYPADGLAPTVHTEWSFASARPTGAAVPGCGTGACEVLPVLLLGYDLPVDLANRAPAGGTFTFEVSAVRPAEYTADAPVASLAVELSYDNGATWQNAKVGGGQAGSYKVSAEHPELARTDGYVSLRVRATDADGNSTLQVIDHAYRLS